MLRAGHVIIQDSGVMPYYMRVSPTSISCDLSTA